MDVTNMSCAFVLCIEIWIIVLQKTLKNKTATLNVYGNVNHITYISI